MLYGHGLAAVGLDPARLLIVDTPNPSRRLAALDDILRTEGLAAVVMEYDGVQKSADYWMRLARRAQLAAEDSGTTAFLLGAPIGLLDLKQLGRSNRRPILTDGHILPWFNAVSGI